MIELKDIKKVFNEGRPNQYAALSGITLEIKLNVATVLRGPSGSGKTTLLSVIGCMSRPTQGRIYINGTETTSLTERHMTGIRRKTFGFVFQHFNLIRGITAIENAMLPAYATGQRQSDIKMRAEALFKEFGIMEKADSKAEWLSGGQMQRVAIARALINNPSILIADEPTAHLDTKLSKTLLEMLSRLKQEGKTLIISSHDPFVCESSLVDRIIEIRDGALENAA